jgi:hypothetical protein
MKADYGMLGRGLLGLFAIACGASSTPGNGSKTSWVQCQDSGNCPSTEACIQGVCQVSSGAAPGFSDPTLASLDCDPLLLSRDGAGAGFVLSNYAVGSGNEVLALLTERLSSFELGSTRRVFLGNQPLREHVVQSVSVNERGDTVVGFDLDGANAVATFGTGSISAGVPGPQVPTYVPVTLTVQGADGPLRRRFDQFLPELDALKGQSFSCLPDHPDPPLPPELEGPMCRANARFGYCVNADFIDVTGQARTLDLDLTVEAAGVGVPPTGEHCPFSSQQQIGNTYTSDDITIAAETSWLQASDAEGHSLTLTLTAPGFRLPVSAGDELHITLDTQVYVFQGHFELRTSEGELLTWFAMGNDAASLVTPTEFSLATGDAECSGLEECIGTTEIHSLEFDWQGKRQQLLSNELGQVDSGAFIHSGQHVLTGPSTHPCTDATLIPLSAAFFTAKGLHPDTGGIGGPCQYPIADGSAAGVGQAWCMGGLGYPDGYVTARCESDDDCPSESVCDGQLCRAPCQSDADCALPLDCSGPKLDAEHAECRCGEACLAARCDVESCPDACPDAMAPGVSYFSRDPLTCLDDSSSCGAGFVRFDLAGCGCGCQPIPVEQCPVVPEVANFDYVPGGCEPQCASGELPIQTSCGCGCVQGPQCSRFDPLDDTGPIYLGAPGECSSSCDENNTPIDDDCGCFCFWTRNLSGLCDAPPDAGPCTQLQTRYYRDAYTGLCAPFEFGGCLGNWNNFRSLEECQALCGG